MPDPSTVTIPPAAPPAAPPPPRLRPAADPSVAIRAAGAGVVAALLVPGHRAGAGVLVAAVVLGLAVRPRVRTPTDGLLLTVSACLQVVAVLRDAGWLVALCLLASLACWSVLLSGAEGAPGVLRGLVAVPLRGLSAGGFLVRPAYGLTSERNRRAATPALRGAVTGVVLLAVFGTLFASADTAFAELLGRLAVPAPGPLTLGRLSVGVMVALVAGGAVLTALHPVGRRLLGPRTGRPLATVEWALPLVLLDLLFAAFVSVQLTVLFGGRDHVLSTAGLSYADYARQGFAQLVVAAVLTLAVVGQCVRLVPLRGRLLTALLGVLCALTLVVLLSASRRLGLYEQQFGYTRLRLSVDAAIGWLAVVLLLVILAGCVRRAPWLPRAVVLSAALGLLVFAVADPEARIAERNVQRFHATGELDAAYLQTLSADAAPALAALPGLCARGVDADPWWNLNLSRRSARLLPSRSC